MDFKRGQIPLVRILLPFATGIGFALCFTGHFAFIYATSTLFLALFLYTWYDSKYTINYSKRWIFGALLAALLFCTGYSFTFLHVPEQKVSDISNHLEDTPHSFLVSIISEPEEKDKTIKTVAEVLGIVHHGKVERTTGKIMLYFMKDSLGDTVRYGDMLTVRTQLSEVKSPMNPDEFDYKSYLALHGITYEGFVPKHSYSYTGSSDIPWLLRFTDKCRHKLISVINQYVKGDEAAVGSAILLGYREDLSPDVVHNFADSGAVHVICVAGLHVGILFVMLNFLLSFFDRVKHGKIIRTILLLLLLWLYALFTGMATPVMRATIMFSFLLVGKQFGRYTNSLNTLAASALFVLLLNPFALADTGFQLSYLSVAGILIIYPFLKNLLSSRYFIIEKTWELTCLSASAQVAIAPLSLLYFHQFPNYFIITNLLVVPLLSIVIYSGVLFLITSHIPFIATITTFIFQKSLWLMNLIIIRSHSLPLYVTRGVSISPIESFIIYLFIIWMMIFFFSKKYRAIFISFSCLTILMGIRIYKDIIHSNQQMFIVYHVSKHPACAFISGKQCIIPFSEIDSSAFTYHVQYNLWEHGIKDTLTINKDTNATMLSGHLAVHNNFMQFNGKRYAFIRTNDDMPDSMAAKLNVHCVIVSGAYNKGMEALQNEFNFDTLIFDSSITPARVKKWKRECAELNIKYYDVGKDGAYIES